jgi:hypothetical protein
MPVRQLRLQPHCSPAQSDAETLVLTWFNNVDVFIYGTGRRAFPTASPAVHFVQAAHD